MADWGAIGAVGRGITEGLDDKRRSDEAAQMKKLRDYQLAQLEEDQQVKTKLKGIKKVGTPTYDKALEKEGASPEQAKQLDAQTADFGAEGAQATADAMKPGPAKAAPVKGIPYTASAQAADIGQTLLGTNPEAAAKFADRAYSLGEREMQERINAWTQRVSRPDFSLADAAKELADLHTAGRGEGGAFIKATPDNPEGLPEAVVFNDKGESITRPVRNKQELIELGQGLVSHTARAEMTKMAMERTKLGLEGRKVGAAEKGAEATDRNSRTAEREFNAKEMAGAFKAQVDVWKAQAEASRLTAPAQAAQANAHARYFKFMGDKLDAEGKVFGSKLPEGQKQFLVLTQGLAVKAAHDAMSDPSNAPLQVAAINAKYQFALQLKNAGAKDVDEYALSGLPPPQLAAENILSDKPKPAVVAQKIAQTAQQFGMKYATEIKQFIDAKEAEKAKISTSNSTGAAPPLTPRPFDQQIFGRFTSREDLAEGLRRGIPGAVERARQLEEAEARADEQAPHLRY